MVREAHEQVQWTCENDERRSGTRPSVPRGRDARSVSEGQEEEWSAAALAAADKTIQWIVLNDERPSVSEGQEQTYSPERQRRAKANFLTFEG